MHTRGNTQWFYFAVRRMLPGVMYKFNILNNVKPDSLFNGGMQPLVYSTADAQRHRLGWRRRAHSVCYYQNHIKRRSSFYYTLSFQLSFQHADDIAYLAYCHPHSLTEYNQYMKRLEDDAMIKKREASCGLTSPLPPPLPLPRTLTKVACAAESTLEALMHSLTPASRRALDAQPASCLGGKRRIPRRSSPLGGPPTP